MDKISIIGGNKLSGNIAISGAKNASLPLMASSLLTEEDLILGNIPQLNDVRDMGKGTYCVFLRPSCSPETS